VTLFPSLPLPVHWNEEFGQPLPDRLDFLLSHKVPYRYTERQPELCVE
jgi:hypothetical protein